eukprot:2213163-Pyramimonas_sp.AAC.1
MVQTLLDATNRQQLSAIADMLKPHKKAIQELVAVTASVAKELSTGITAAKKRMQQERDLAARTAEKASAGKKKTTLVAPASQLAPQGVRAENPSPIGPFSYLPLDEVKQLVSEPDISFFPKYAAGEITLTEPLIVSTSSSSPQFQSMTCAMSAENSNPLRVARQMFESEWLQHPFRQSAGRAQKAVHAVTASDAASDEVFNAFAQFLDGDVMMLHAKKANDVTKDLLDIMKPAFFAGAMNRLHCAPDRGYMTTARMTVVGTRE